MKLENLRVAVTGGAGFIGSHVVDQLVAGGSDVVVIDDLSTGRRENIATHQSSDSVTFHQADIQDRDAMKRLLRGTDVVIHMAVASLRASLNDPESVHQINTTGTIRTCHAALENGVERFVYVSSSEAYGSAATVPMDEDHPLDPTTVYGASKAAGELYALAYWHTYGMATMVVRPFNTYGPREHSEGTSAEVIPKFVMRGLAGLRPVIFHTGEQTRDFTWVEDTARGIIMAAQCDELVGDRVNVACGQEVSIVDICKKVMDRLGRGDLEPEFVGEGRPGDVMRHYADISKISRLTGFQPTVDIDTGLDRYIEWVQRQDIDLDLWVEQERVQNW